MDRIYLFCRLKSVYYTKLYIQFQFNQKYNIASKPFIKDEWRKRRNIIFNNEIHNLKNQVGRITKIKVKFSTADSQTREIELFMNKDLSTPNDCALHLSEDLQKTAALALVNNEPWDMHRPLTQDCSLKILTMQMPKDSSALNSTFWRSCSFVMGCMIESAFKHEVQLFLHSFPWPNVKSGSFIYDVVLDLPNWKPTNAELHAMSAQFIKICKGKYPIERLQVNETLALDMFQDNPYKSHQIPYIAKSQNGFVTLYRIGEHIDISKGPLVGNTNTIGKVTVTAVHKNGSNEMDHMYRFQGIALPRGVHLNHYAYKILENRAKQLNQTVRIPQKLFNDIDVKNQIVKNY